MVERLDARRRPPSEAVAELRRPGGFLSAKVRDAARRIVEDVRERGDEALLEHTERFDGVRPDQIRVPGDEIERARASLPADLEDSFLTALENVRAFHEREMDRSWETNRNGATVGQRVRPLRRAGIYVPGGHGAYPSTLMMAAVPARVARVREICVCAPPGPDGRVSHWVLAVAGLLGLGEIYAVGGAQAIGAMTYGPESVRAVDKVVGPGNNYVTAAELEVFGTVGIDAPQGPSEVVVIADASAFPERVARDLMAQAEHLSGASAILISPSAGLLEDVMPLLTGEPAKLATLVHVRDLAQAVEISNLYAPEHAHVISEDHEAVLQDLDAVGMIAVGDTSPWRWPTTAPVPRTPCRPVGPRPGPRLWAPTTSPLAPTTSTTPARPSRSSARTSSASRGSRASRTTPRASPCACGKRGIMARIGRVERETGETTVGVELNLDGSGRAEISTGVGFFDHLLHLLAHHNGMDLRVKAKGDTWVDDHHTVEDAGLVLGRALDDALGDRSNLARFADASAPLIEALSIAVVDLGGRSHLTCNLGPMPEKIGTFDTELFPEFLRAFTQYGRFTLHLNCYYGENTHHKVESGVKAMALALRAGISPRTSGIASTKGVVD
jgi:histidinol dehydrogenase